MTRLDRRRLVIAALAAAALSAAIRPGVSRAEAGPVRFEAERRQPLIRMTSAYVRSPSDGWTVPPGDREAGPALPRGVARTAVDHRFSASGGVVGSLGYLCGIQKSPDGLGDLKGAYEPAGTFLGGQLKVAF